MDKYVFHGIGRCNQTFFYTFIKASMGKDTESLNLDKTQVWMLIRENAACMVRKMVKYKSFSYNAQVSQGKSIH